MCKLLAHFEATICVITMPFNYEMKYVILPCVCVCVCVALANLKAALVALSSAVPPSMGGAHGMMLPGGCVVLVSNLNEQVRLMRVWIESDWTRVNICT